MNKQEENLLEMRRATPDGEKFMGGRYANGSRLIYTRHKWGISVYDVPTGEEVLHILYGELEEALNEREAA